VSDIFTPVKQRAALKKLATAITSSSTALRIDECGDPRINGAHGHVYATPEGFQLFVMTETARAWTAAKKALGFAKVCNDGDEEGAFILDRLPSPSEAITIRRYLEIPKRREVSEETKARLALTRKPFVAGRRSQAEKVALAA
jgi:hypothetical protein